MSSYRAAVENLFALQPELGAAPRRKFDLEHMRRLAAALGDPQRRVPAVLIAGTNGKGSTSATLASMLGAAGYRTGLYTSPHLVRVNERIQIFDRSTRGEAISDAEFGEIYDRVKQCADELVANGGLPATPSFFETLTAMAFEYFASIGVEMAVLEVGLGGRLDATNISDPLISVITDIDLDHQQWLGNTLAEIAREKAGILRERGTVVMLPQHPEVNPVLGEAAMALGARAVSAVKFLPEREPRGGEGGAREAPHNRYSIEWEGKRVEIDSPLYGRHQWRNLALALAAAHELRTHFGYSRITAEAVERGVRETKWRGRFEVCRAAGGEYVLDVAHNPAGAWALRSALSAYAGERPVTIVFGAMQDKKIDEIASILFPVAERVVLTRAQSSRAAMPAMLAEQAAHTGAEFALADSVAEALEMAREQAMRGATEHPRQGGAPLVVVTGSVYVVGEALAALDRQAATPQPAGAAR